MNEAELLTTIAEIAVAFAGFASLVSVLSARGAGQKLTMNLGRLRGMLQTALIAAAFAFAPFVPFKFGVASDESWRIAGIVFAVSGVIRGALVFRANRAVLDNPFWLYAIMGAQSLALLALGLSAMALSISTVIGLYHFALLLYLASAGFLFMRAATSVFNVEPAGTSKRN